MSRKFAKAKAALARKVTFKAQVKKELDVKRLKAVMVRKLDRVKATLARNIAKKKARQERRHKKSLLRADASANAAAHRALKLKKEKYKGLRIYSKIFVHKKNKAHRRNGPNRRTTAKTRKMTKRPRTAETYTVG